MDASLWAAIRASTSSRFISDFPFALLPMVSHVLLQLLLVGDLRRSRDLGARHPTADSTGLGLVVSHSDELGDDLLNLLVAFHENRLLLSGCIISSFEPGARHAVRLGITVPCGAWARREAPRAGAPGVADARRSSTGPGARWSGSSGRSPSAPAGSSRDGSPNRRSHSEAGPSHRDEAAEAAGPSAASRLSRRSVRSPPIHTMWSPHMIASTAYD